MEEAYVSFETAKLLKEKGFRECSGAGYNSKGQLQVGYAYWNISSVWYAAPTLQMAMKWLREVHNKHCDIGYDLDLYWFFQIIELKELKEHFDYSELKYYHAENETGFNTYEKAAEAALKYCIENLI
jgi:hypothetical protein